MSSTGTTTWRSSGLRVPASTIATSRSGPTPPRNRAITSSGRCVADRPIRCIGGASGVRGVAECLEPLEAEGEVGAALGAGDRVDLVDDDVLDAAQDLAGRAGQHQVQRLGRRDQDVGRVAGDLSRRSSAGVSPVRLATEMCGDGFAEALGRQGDPGQRRPEVALDVVGQCLERRDVQDTDEAGRLARRRRAGVGREAVQRPQERGKGLAAAGRSVDERVMAARDRGPAAHLGVGRRLEARPEPVADGRRERGERVRRQRR